MEQSKYPPAEIRYNENLFSIELFKTYPKEAEIGSLYNTTFDLRVVSGAFCGYAPCEYDIKEFSRFASEMEDIYLFKRSRAELNDICYGSKVVFEIDKIGHLEISGEIFDSAMQQSLVFKFSADQTCLKSFLETIKAYVK